MQMMSLKSARIPAILLVQMLVSYGDVSCGLPDCPLPDLPFPFGDVRVEFGQMYENMKMAEAFTILNFTCFDGYSLFGSPVVVCLDGNWSRELPVCAKSECSNPVVVEHATVVVKQGNATDSVIGSIAEYSCVDGYELVNPEASILVCSLDRENRKATWEGEKPICDKYWMCGLGKENVGLGGQRTTEPWPWMAALNMADRQNGPEKSVQCGGSIISRHFILTAAHCMYYTKTSKRKEEDITVKLGVMHLDDVKHLQELEVRKIYVHENFSLTSFDYDIALLELRTPIQYNAYVRSICLPPKEIPENNPYYKPQSFVWVAGWGHTSRMEKYQVPGRIANKHLKEIALPIQSRETCRESLLDDNLYLTDRMFCAGSGGERNDTCFGDSGGPVMYPQMKKDGYVSWTQIGIVSWGLGCGLEDEYGMYVHLQTLMPWVERTIQEAKKYESECSNPVAVEHATVVVKQGDSADSVIGSIAEYSCLDGYELANPNASSLVCSLDRETGKTTWEGEKPICGNYSVCGLGKEHVGDGVGRIVGGQRVTEPWPWMAALNMTEYPKRPEKSVHCGGSIINEHFILTAAHCMYYPQSTNKRKGGDITVKLGVIHLDDVKHLQELEVRKIYVHEKYSMKTKDYDIALLELKTPIKYTAYVRPICLPPKEIPDNSPFYKPQSIVWVTGWGDVSIQWKYQKGIITKKHLKEIALPIQSQETCRESLSDDGHRYHYFSDRMFCAGTGLGGNDTCSGDSGGPVMFRQLNKDGYVSWTQIGIVSWGMGCGLVGEYGMYVHLQKLMPWVEKTIEDARKFGNLKLSLK